MSQEESCPYKVRSRGKAYRKYLTLGGCLQTSSQLSTKNFYILSFLVSTLDLLTGGGFFTQLCLGSSLFILLQSEHIFQHWHSQCSQALQVVWHWHLQALQLQGSFLHLHSQGGGDLPVVQQPIVRANNLIKIKMMRNIFKIFKSSLPLLVIPYTLSTYHNFFFWNRRHANKIDGRVFIDVQISNKPCEDRSSITQLQNIPGYAVAVFDGHGGWQVSNFCSQVLLERLDTCLARNKSKISDEEQLIKTSLRDAFQSVENQFLDVARKGYGLGFGKMARAGSCALVCVVANNKIYSANAGDSLGLIIEQDENKKMSYVQLNKEFNANKPDERERLMKLFPKEDDVVVCKKQGNSSCYVKGRLQPTRSLGDLRLKHGQFNNPQNYSTDHEYQSPLKQFTGPYITWEPQIRVFPLKKSYKSVILASDGLWDELERQEVAELFKSNEKAQMPKILIERALSKAADAAKTTVQGLREIPAGKKRKLHDDITVVVVDLEGQFNI